MKKLTLPLAMAATLAAATLGVPAHAQDSAESKILTHQAVGEPRSGGDTLEQAPELPAGASQDLLPVTGEDHGRYYKLPAVDEGERVHVSAQLIVDPLNQPTSRESIRLDGELVTLDGKQCSSRDNVRISRAQFDGPALLTLDTGVKLADSSGGCLSQNNDEVYLKISRDGLWQADTEIPLELRVIVEPAMDPTTLSGLLPEKLPPASLSVDAPAEPVSGGSGFATATELAGTSVSTDSVLPFEVKYYRVHVSEGQRLNYRLTVGDSREASAQRLVTAAFSPLLSDQIMDRPSQALEREQVGSSVTRNTLSEVSRDLVDAHSSQSWLRTPGYYYITVSGAARDPRGLSPLEYELAVELTGEATASDHWEPASDLRGAEGTSLGFDATASNGWLPSTAQLGALLGGVAVALAGFAGVWFLGRRKRS